LKGNEYSDLIAAYLVATYGARDLTVYREVSLGKTIIGKNRRVDLLAIHEPSQVALAIECKYQATQGTVDEKIPYTLQDMDALRVASCITYAGEGFSQGVRHMLEAHHMAAHCLPEEDLKSTAATRELDHIVAMTFSWWELVVRDKKPFTLTP
jgi:hypothetical protein